MISGSLKPVSTTTGASPPVMRKPNVGTWIAVPGESASARKLVGALDEGLRFKQVARRLGITEATAKTHARNLFRKLGATSRGEAVRAARDRGLLA